MYDPDQDRDYAEERANLADMRRELEGEAAHERLVTRIADALRELSAESRIDAHRILRAIGEEVDLRIAVNAHRYELLARRQQTGHLASAAAVAVELYGGYDLDAAVARAGAAWLSTHDTGADDLLGRAAREAVRRIREVVEQILAADEQEQQSARDAADLAETERSLR